MPRIWRWSFRKEGVDAGEMKDVEAGIKELKRVFYQKKVG